jgi:hypothetical protein
MSEASWLAVIGGALGGGILVIAFESLRRWWMKPVFRIVTNDAACMVESPYRIGDVDHQSRFLFARVENVGRSTAVGCRCFLLGISRQADDGSKLEIKGELIDLVWSVTDQPESDIPAGVSRNGVICRTVSAPALQTLDAWTAKWPRRYQQFVGPVGLYEVAIGVAAANAPLKRATCRFRFRGAWNQIEYA